MMELMFAIGIFAVGMSLIAGLFPAAIKESENTVKDYEGPTICENGLAIVKARLTDTMANSMTSGNLDVLNSAIAPGPLDRVYRTYDTNDDGTDDRQRGFIPLAKRWAAGRNDYQIVIVAYDVAINNVSGNPNTVEAITLTSTISALEKDTLVRVQLTGGGLSGNEYMSLIGSPFIDRNSGRYATIESVAEEGGDYYAYLDHPVYESISPSGAMVIVERDANNNIIDGSPVIGVLMTRTALRD